MSSYRAGLLCWTKVRRVDRRGLPYFCGTVRSVSSRGSPDILRAGHCCPIGEPEADWTQRGGLRSYDLKGEKVLTTHCCGQGWLFSPCRIVEFLT